MTRILSLMDNLYFKKPLLDTNSNNARPKTLQYKLLQGFIIKGNMNNRNCDFCSLKNINLTNNKTTIYNVG